MSIFKLLFETDDSYYDNTQRHNSEYVDYDREYSSEGIWSLFKKARYGNNND